MTAPNPLAARRRTNSSSCSLAVPSSWEESVVSGAIANRFAISRPQLNLKGDQTTIDQISTWNHRSVLRPILRDTSLRSAPQDEVNSLKHHNLMLRSEQRERLEAWAASDLTDLGSSVPVKPVVL